MECGATHVQLQIQAAGRRLTRFDDGSPDGSRTSHTLGDDEGTFTIEESVDQLKLFMSVDRVGPIYSSAHILKAHACTPVTRAPAWTHGHTHTCAHAYGTSWKVYELEPDTLVEKRTELIKVTKEKDELRWFFAFELKELGRQIDELKAGIKEDLKETEAPTRSAS